MGNILAVGLHHQVKKAAKRRKRRKTLKNVLQSEGQRTSASEGKRTSSASEWKRKSDQKMKTWKGHQ
jgi:hypothetical protein